MPALPPGYRIEQQLGRGTMSDVYLAQRDGRADPVVLKLLRSRRADNPTLWRRFCQESTLLATLNSPHLLHIVEHGDTDDGAFIATEYVSGGNLRELMRARLSPAQALALLRQAGQALKVIHGAGIIHRDLKPENFLRRRDGTVVLIDFGVARSVSHPLALTLQGEVVGSPVYMAPEQAQGGLVMPAADIYSLGINFYEWLCGQRPYPGSTLMEVLAQHLMTTIPQLAPPLAPYQTLLNGMLAKPSSQRYPDAQALLQAVQELETSLELGTQ